MGPGLRIFLASFVVLFLEVALIRWLPAHIRLLSYFSNFILLAAFLGIGLGCLLARIRANLFLWFPPLLVAVLAVAFRFRLEIAVRTTGTLYFSSGTSEPVVAVESALLLPLIFVAVAAWRVLRRPPGWSCRPSPGLRRRSPVHVRSSRRLVVSPPWPASRAWSRRWSSPT